MNRSSEKQKYSTDGSSRFSEDTDSIPAPRSIRSTVGGDSDINHELASIDAGESLDLAIKSLENNEIHETSKRSPFVMTKFTVYETKEKMYFVGSNTRESRFRMLEIDLTTSKQRLAINVRKQRYTRTEIMEILQTLEKEHGSSGFTKRLTAFALLGFIRFTEGYYMVCITKRSVVATIGGHYIYHIDGTEILPLVHSKEYKKPDRRSDEARLLSSFQTLDLSKTFYFSYTYDLTHTLQHNIIREKERALGLLERADDVAGEYHEMFVWNHFLLQPILENRIYSDKSDTSAFDWFRPIIHGFVDQAKISDFGRSILLSIIARRSHYFAGARFLKRGVNDQGNVANEVETEQIVTDYLTSSLHDNKDGIFNNPRYSSYVQHRGSIPLYWSQDLSNMSPKPPIGLSNVDPFYSAAALHFDDMFSRYGGPILILNLIKIKERTPRESILGKEFENCIRYLNQFLPDKSKLSYTAWDMSRASKGRDQEVIDFLEKYADDTLKKTGIFHNGKNLTGMKIQDGICRSNCIDCLDRTNAAQFVIAKRALAYQLQSLGVIAENANLEYDSDAVNLLTEMYHDHGDTIALQYGGSHLVNTMETYRKINQWTSHSRDMIESIRRYYSNSFVDSQRQEAINIFLGIYIWEEGGPSLWDLPSDHFLHNSLYNEDRLIRSYRKWWIPYNLKSLHDRLKDVEEIDQFEEEPLLPYSGFYDNYWNECYRPRQLTSFHLTFAFNINSTLRYLPMTTKKDEIASTSPFIPRKREHNPYSGISNSGKQSYNDHFISRRRTNGLSANSRHSTNKDNTDIRRTALKRASMILQQSSTGIPKLFSERVFSGGKSKSKENLKMEDEKPEKSIDNSTITLTQSSSDIYEQYANGDTRSSGDLDAYEKFFDLPETIVTNQNVTDDSYKVYDSYCKIDAASDMVPEQSRTLYNAWLSVDSA